MILNIISAVAPLIGKWFDNEADAEKFKAELTEKLLQNEDKLMEAKRDIIVAEAQGESWLQRNWRPVLMLSIVAIVVNNYLIAPYVQAFGGMAIQLDLPDSLFTLMTVGVGGYVAGRSGEKIMKEYKK